MPFDCPSTRGWRGLEIALFYGYNQLIAGKYLVITAAYGAGLIRENILAVRCFNKAVVNNHSFSPLVKGRGGGCSKVTKAAAINSDVVADAVNNVIKEYGRFSRTAGIIERAVLYRQVNRRVALTVNFNAVAIGIKFAVAENNILAAVSNLRNRLGKCAAGEYELGCDGLLHC